MATANERTSAMSGNKILASGTHAINLVGFVSRDDATTITGATINGVELDEEGLEKYFPEGTTFYKTELFMFPNGESPSSITVGTGGSISVIRGE